MLVGLPSGGCPATYHVPLFANPYVCHSMLATAGAGLKKDITGVELVIKCIGSSKDNMCGLAPLSKRHKTLLKELTSI